MKFFIPNTKSPEQAEQLYEATKKFAAESTGSKIAEARVRSITFSDHGKMVLATVGEREPCEGLETVMAILDSQTYLVCTWNRGVRRGLPYMIGTNEVSNVELFDKA